LAFFLSPSFAKKVSHSDPNLELPRTRALEHFQTARFAAARQWPIRVIKPAIVRSRDS
jgi:hypothetical protein